MSREFWKFVAILIAGFCIVLFFTESDEGPLCAEVGTTINPVPLAEYRDGIWYGPDGNPVGYAKTSTSKIYNHPDCA